MIDQTIMFHDIYKVKRTGKIVVLLFRDGSDIKLNFSKDCYAEDVYDYYTLAVRAFE